MTIGTCAYCGKPWVAMAGTQLTGHLVCALTPLRRQTIEELVAEDPTISDRVVAAKLDVPITWAVGWRKIMNRQKKRLTKTTT